MAKRFKSARFPGVGAVLAALFGTIGVIAVAQAPERRGRFGGLYPTYEPDDNTGLSRLRRKDAGAEGERRPDSGLLCRTRLHRRRTSTLIVSRSL